MSGVSKEEVREKVRDEMRKYLEPKPTKSLEEALSEETLEEGIADSFTRAFTAIAGFSLGGSLGAVGGQLVSLPVILATVGLVNPVGLTVWAGTAAAFGAYGAYRGARFGYQTGKELTGETLESAVALLKQNVNRRDAMLTEVSRSGDPAEAMKKIKRELEQVTKEQKKLAKKIKKFADEAANSGNISPDKHRELMTLVSAASEGKLSEISKDKIRV